MDTILILVVQDDDLVRSSIAKLLQRQGYETRVAVSVKSARKNFNLSHFNLIISDLRLPGGPGTDLIGLARPVPVIITTRNASLRSAVDTMRQGAADYIPKPFDTDELLASVKRAIATSEPVKDYSNKTTNEDPSDFSIEDYFTYFVQKNQDTMTETLLAQKLGISRKSLWQRRKKLGILRAKPFS
jgi:DNA-binding NtrC family response regulator